MSNEEIVVSVYCLTYNHEKYIGSALEGFVKQKTNFAYEVIVHDDASSDKTTEIIKKYQENYPHIIKPIFQDVNQYSQGVKITNTFVFPKMKGKYIAVCEGDDYWIDENKLQKQVDFLDSHPEYSACTHSTLFVNEKNNKKYISHKEKKDCDLDIADIIEWKDKAYHTSSLMYRKEYYSMPEEFGVAKIGDYPRAIYLSLKGKIRFLKDVSSVYRMFTEGSWSSAHERKIGEVNKEIINMLYAIDKYTKGAYHTLIELAVDDRKYQTAMSMRQYDIVWREYRKILNKQTFIIRMHVFLNVYFSGLMKIYYKIKSKFI